MKHLDRKTLIFVAIAVATVAQLAFAGVAALSRSRGQRQLAEIQQNAQNRADQVAVLRHQLELQSPLDKVAWRLLDSPDVADTLGALQALGDAAGVTFDSAKASPSATRGKQTFVVSGNGLPEQVCAFAAALEKSERLMIVENGRLSPATGDKISFEFGIATFQRGGGR